MILICISLMISNVEHLVMCLFAGCISSFENCLLSSSAYLKNWIVFHWWGVVWAIYMCWILILYRAYTFQILSPIQYVDLLFCQSVQFSSVAQSCLTLCNPMNCSTPGLPVHHQLPEFTQTHIHRVSDAIQPSHPLSFPSPLAPNPS